MIIIKYCVPIVAILCIFLTSCLAYDPSTWKLAEPLNFEDPTPAEVLRAFSRKGHECWGQQMRIDGDVRLLMIGGSQTAEVEDDGSGLSQLIHDQLQKIYGPKSYALNKGRGSVLPKVFIGARYDFEDWETSRWPNCVMLDFSLNSIPEDGWSSAKDIEKIIRSIKHKYIIRGLRIPDFFFIEYMMIRGFNIDDLSGNYNSSALRYKRINQLSVNVTDSFFAGNGFNRGCATCAYLNELADFHGYPVISIRNALFPAFERFHLRMKPNDIDVYYLSADGIHLSIWGRCFVINYIFSVFWKRVMTPRRELPMKSVYSHIYDADLSLMAPEPITMEVARWTSWGNEVNTLERIVSTSSHFIGGGRIRHANNKLPEHQTSDEMYNTSSERGNHWRFVSTYGHEKDRGHICYGSKVKSSVGLFNFSAPIECSVSTPCVMQLAAVHSWNQTHYGDMTCTLYGHALEPTLVGRLGRPGYLRRRGLAKLKNFTVTSHAHEDRKLRNTVPLDIVLDSNVTAGPYVIQCVKSDDRLSCVSSIKISQMLLI